VVRNSKLLSKLKLTPDGKQIRDVGAVPAIASRMRVTPVGLLALLLIAGPSLSPGATLYYNSYTQAGHAPAGFYAGGAAQHIEDMETGVLRFGISANTGGIIPPGFEGVIDSVLTDGNPLHAPGHRGHSWFSGNGAGGVTFTFDVAHTAAGLVWTDGEGTTYAEFFRGATSLGIIGPLSLADGSFSGTTGEDTFFGITDALGITSIRVWNTAGGIEIDHVQFGNMAMNSVPDAGITALLLLAGFGGLVLLRRGLRTNMA